MRDELVQVLKLRVDSIVTLVLDDGEVVDAKTFFVDSADHGDVIYDVSLGGVSRDVAISLDVSKREIQA